MIGLGFEFGERESSKLCNWTVMVSIIGIHARHVGFQVYVSFGLNIVLWSLVLIYLLHSLWNSHGRLGCPWWWLEAIKVAGKSESTAEGQKGGGVSMFLRSLVVMSILPAFSWTTRPLAGKTRPILCPWEMLLHRPSPGDLGEQFKAHFFSFAKGEPLSEN